MRPVGRKARAWERIEAVAATFRARGIEVSGDLMRDCGLFAEHPLEARMAAALACTDEVDSRRRVGEGTEQLRLVAGRVRTSGVGGTGTVHPEVHGRTVHRAP